MSALPPRGVCCEAAAAALALALAPVASAARRADLGGGGGSGTKCLGACGGAATGARTKRASRPLAERADMGGCGNDTGALALAGGGGAGRGVDEEDACGCDGGGAAAGEGAAAGCSLDRSSGMCTRRARSDEAPPPAVAPPFCGEVGAEGVLRAVGNGGWG